MAVTIELPTDIEQDLRRSFGDLDRTAKEAMLVELYRQDKLTHRQLGEALDLDRFETEATLKKYRVTEDFPSDAEYEAALSRLGVLLRP